MTTTDKPKVTVLISTFNRPQYLEEAIDSVVKQRYTDWELIVLNDGGQNVQHVVDKFADPRIIYVDDTENKGAARRFNQGLALARGEYVTYLGDDDRFYPNHVEVLAKALDEHPEVALAYSDLYAISSLSDPKTGKRFALDKRIAVSRGFNREFMFHYNHVLHVSLMHRLDAAKRVGGFDESVKVLIEWSLNRRLAFLYDFYHVEEVTGEYFMPVFKSDRISVRERRNKEAFQHNLRRIRCSFPAEPWTKIARIDLLYVVEEWGEKLNTHLKEIIDNFDHPFKITLINNGTGTSVDQARESLGELTELKNISILHMSEKDDRIYAFRRAAKRSDAKYLFLVTPDLQAAKLPKRLFASIQAFEENQSVRAIRWDVEEERKSPFDCLIERQYFLDNSKPGEDNMVNVQSMNLHVAKGFKFDAMFTSFKKELREERNYPAARRIMEEILRHHAGFPHIQYLIHYLTPVCLAQKDYDRAERALRALIERGYRPDNLIRLGVLLQRSGRYGEAIEVLKEALAEHGLHEDDFESGCFPAAIPRELSIFHLMIAMAESYLELHDPGQAARYFHMAAKLKSDSHKPFLGFAKVYIQSGQWDRVEATLHRLPELGGKDDPETHRLLAKLCQRRKQLPLAFDCLIKATECAPYDENNIDPLYFIGAALQRWPEMVEPLRKFVDRHSDHAVALSRLASVYFNQGFNVAALEMAERCLTIAPDNPIAKSLAERIARASKAFDAADGGLVNHNGLSLDLGGGLIAW